MLVDYHFFSNFYLHWFFSNLSFFERDPHMDSPEGIRVNSCSLFPFFQTLQFCSALFQFYSIICRLIRHSFCLSSNPCQLTVLHSIPLLSFSILSKSFLFLPFSYWLPLSSSGLQLSCPFIPASPPAISILFLIFPFSDACLPYPAIILFLFAFLPACFVQFHSICYACCLVSSFSLSIPLCFVLFCQSSPYAPYLF